MVKIKIIKGVYGYKYNGRTIPKDSKSDAFEVEELEAKRLVGLGIAEVANKLKSQADKPIKYSESLAPVKNIVEKDKKEDEKKEDNNKDQDSPDGNNQGDEDDKPEYSMKNTQKELYKLAVYLGFEGPEDTTKANLIAFLDEKNASEDAPNIANNAGVVD